jgi:hypothetical protein
VGQNWSMRRLFAQAQPSSLMIKMSTQLTGPMEPRHVWRKGNHRVTRDVSWEFG